MSLYYSSLTGEVTVLLPVNRQCDLGDRKASPPQPAPLASVEHAMEQSYIVTDLIVQASECPPL